MIVIMSMAAMAGITGGGISVLIEVGEDSIQAIALTRMSSDVVGLTGKMT